MDILSVLRTLGALGIVLGMLGGALWAVRRYDIRLPSRFLAGPQERRLAVVERLALDGRRSVALIRAGDREHTVLIAPEGLLLLDAAKPTSPRSLADA
ncbi:flagellar biosynthetic protein FliO [Sphingomonas sp. PR090111-T3T-6A]|uniref:flagellar biosynthetic protein FliO n=1 Tax=Sphingomonas sp. PR090111-T3T-6A TaxID=685778 RepID=UPI0003695EE9|nr:flagellar biosynthetic protein FliO [Sphingomonas sp. PR090111-T3T-6A]